MIKKAKIEDAIYDVISYNEYCKNRETYNKYSGSIAIEDGSGYILPIRTPTDIRPGFYPAPSEGIDFFKSPVGRECSLYDQSNVINFSEAKNLRGIIEAQDKLNKAERSILISIDNVTLPEIYDNDSPFMKAIKTAIIKKHIDLDKYAHRFGENYANDKRLLKKDDMTQQKGITFANCLDYDMYMIFKDTSPDVPNPIGEPIVVKLTGENAGFYDGYPSEQIETITTMATNNPGTTSAASYPQGYYPQYSPYGYPIQGISYGWWQTPYYWGFNYGR